MIFPPLQNVEQPSFLCHLIITNYNYTLYSFSWTTCRHYAIVLLQNLVLFPPEQAHFIIAFCASIRSIFSIYSLHICPRRAVCVRLFSVGLTLSRIHVATHRGPSLHPRSSPWKPTFSCQRPFQCGLFTLTSYRPPISECLERRVRAAQRWGSFTWGFILRLNYLPAPAPRGQAANRDFYNNTSGLGSPRQSHAL